MSSASSTPSTATPTSVTAAIPNSNRLTRRSARQAPGSTNPIAAATITAPSTALGR
jgi:hypothetical protein